MTDEHIKSIHSEIHELKLLGKPTPRETALANTATQLINEVRRLRNLAEQAISHLREKNPQRAEELQALINWAPGGPV
jgi:hypothetical protein